MNNNVREEVFDAVLTAALSEYVDSEMASHPSKEELAEMYPVPKDGLRKIQRTIKKSRPKSKTVVYLRRVAVVFLAAVALFAGVMATSTEVRGAVANAIVQFFDQFASIDFSDETHLPAETKVIENVGSFEIGYIPEKLELMESIEKTGNREYTYTSNDGDFLFIGIYSPDLAVHFGDAELSEYEVIVINGIDVHIFYNDDERLGSVFFENSGHTVMISCVLDRVELINIAENIK